MPIRTMKKSDQDEILVLDPKIFPNEPIFTKHDCNFYYDPKFSFVSFDEHNNEINGYVFANIQNFSNTVLIGNIGVAKSYEGRGIGKQLMEAVILAVEQSQSPRINEITLRVRILNERAIGLYKKYGFIEKTHSLDPIWQYMHKSITPSTPKFSKEPTPSPLKENPSAFAKDKKTAKPEAPKSDTSTPSFKSNDNPGFQSSGSASFHDSRASSASYNSLRENSVDVLAVKAEIKRLRMNALSFFSINNTAKANKIEEALNEALRQKVLDVRTDYRVQAALSKQRICGFGCMSTVAITNITDSLQEEAFTP